MSIESYNSSEYLNPEIKNEFKPEISNAVYQKGILADVEINENDFNIIFENKKSSKEDGWLKTAIGQIRCMLHLKFTIRILRLSIL